MKKVLIRCSILFILNVSSACEVYYDVASSTDNDINFSNYKSFAWLPDNTDTINRPYNNEIIRNNIRNFFGKCFFERGFIFDADSPDVLLQLMIVNQKRNKETVFYQNPWPYYYNRYYYHSIYFHPYHFDYYYRSYPVYYLQSFRSHVCKTGKPYYSPHLTQRLFVMDGQVPLGWRLEPS